MRSRDWARVSGGDGGRAALHLRNVQASPTQARHKQRYTQAPDTFVLKPGALVGVGLKHPVLVSAPLPTTALDP